MSRKSLPFYILIASLALLAAAPAAAVATPENTGGAGAEARELFHFLESGREQAAPTSAPEVVEEREVSVDFSLLRGRLALPLLDGRLYPTVRTDFEQRLLDNYTWRGRLLDPDGSGAEVGSATLTVIANRMSGLIFLHDKAYLVAPNPAGDHRLMQIDQARFPTCGGPVMPPVTGSGGRAKLGAPALPRAADSGGPTRITVLLLYTEAAVAALRGSTFMNLILQNAIDLANTGLINSQINARFVPVQMQPVNYAETGDAHIDLDWLANDDSTDRLRRAYGADLVSMIVDRMDNFCGLGFVMRREVLGPEFQPYAYSVVKRSCAIGIMALAHEMGHNLGGEHDPANGAPPDQASFPWSFGHFVDGQFRTIMSYDNQCLDGCQVQPYYSNPGVLFQGQPTGIADQRNNALTFGGTKALISSFAAEPSCREGPNSLCLLGGRFKVDVAWQNQFDNSNGLGVAIPRTDVAGFFSFGDPSNVELIVKILDFGNVIKLFYGELTNLKFAMTVTDFATGKVNVYQNTTGDCGAIDQTAFPKSAGQASGSTAGPANDTATVSGRPAPLASPAPAAGRELATGHLAILAEAAAPVASSSACQPDSHTLCLLGGRFALSVNWSNHGNGTSGQAGTVRLPSDVTGAFYFTDPGNLELLAKILNLGNRIAVFYGTLSDLEYTLTVIDTQSGKVNSYHNATGNFCGGLDNTAFSL